MLRAWSLLTVEEADRQFGGNLGYEDVLGDKYVWNSTVAHSGDAQEGDLVILKDGGWVLGLAWMDEIASGTGKKERRRCPQCGATSFKTRKTRDIPFKCSPCGKEFETPTSETIDVTVFEGYYGRTWRPLDTPMPEKALRSLYGNRSGQQSIRPIKPDGLRELFSAAVGLGSLWWREDGGVRPPIKGGHRQVLQRARVGQAKFRSHLLERYGSCCAITGAQPAECLEAAHLYRYRDTPNHDINGGLLLRRDLHALFDRGLLVIEARTWTVRIAPSLHKYPDLAMLANAPIQVPSQLRPAVSYLEQHLALAIDGWGERTVL
ncbi:hypothetical protein Ssi03_21800 [Sphaerisporangium siamense]|uniref:DNA-directed RNA polymerase subunit RPC12/RpoP n=1 Tax=Sphaerisporangium siamense TaxID=795645 RepID=A0A7W7G9Z4_9ACTN|nr:HNH endonuclease signature motif containing protein [Sphaerisporangium siamense]MBB4701902.1 DNA-directed RNA polymerase subunit RPC12/RpoP [Sphaerisporangium siamense]GII84190.1 hypothetical protein Ssi03_21800 [Sphaerisporangium siamense]